jgi:hypothetical protein
VTISAQQRDPQQRQLEVAYLVDIDLLTPRSVAWGFVAAVLLGLNVWWRQRDGALLMAELWLRVGSPLPRFRL